MGLLTVITLISFLTTLIFAWFIAKPILFAGSGSNSAAKANPELDSLTDSKERCIQVLKDLELDHATQKISNQDYNETKQSLSGEIADILQKIDRENKD